MNRTKCEFFKNKIDYLGYIVSENGIAPNKIESITTYPEPTNLKELGSFLGLASYYRKFVRAFAEKAHPLTALTKKNAKWKWGNEERDAFNCIKQCLTTRPILGYPDFTREFIIYTDASGYGIGAALAQMQTPALTESSETDDTVSAETGDREVVIAYTSKHLNEREAKWSTTEKECFAIIHAIDVFRPYLYGRAFTVFTDHRPLEWLMSKPEPAGRLQRWALKIQEYNMKIGYRPGRSHQNADCLSRIPKDLGAIPKTPTGVGVIAAVTFTPLNEQRKQQRRCSPGMPGARGPVGLNGEMGTSGTHGNQGAPGLQGLTGAPGPQGIAGLNGIQGPSGLPGVKGENGKDGSTGKTGERGIDGTPGRNGMDGLPGVKGSKGELGTDGTNGLPGVTGPKGEPGTDGINGLPGINGSKGDRDITSPPITEKQVYKRRTR